MNTLKQLCRQVEINKELGQNNVSVPLDLFEALVNVAKTASTLADWLDEDIGTQNGTRLSQLKRSLSLLENLQDDH